MRKHETIGRQYIVITTRKKKKKVEEVEETVSDRILDDERTSECDDEKQ